VHEGQSLTEKTRIGVTMVEQMSVHGTVIADVVDVKVCRSRSVAHSPMLRRWLLTTGCPG
jgi:hypothetical protein